MKFLFFHIVKELFFQFQSEMGEVVSQRIDMNKREKRLTPRFDMLLVSMVYAVIILVLAEIGLAQPDILWSRIYGGSGWDEANSIRQTSDGGFIIVGFTESFGAGERDVWLLRTNAAGDTLWTWTFGGSGNDQGHSVQETFDGGFILTGSRNYDLWLIRTGASGDTIWTRTYGRGIGYSVQQTSDSGFIVVGSSLSDFDTDLWLIRTDQVGDTLWTWTYDLTATDNDEGLAVRQVPEGGFIITGYVAHGITDVSLIRTDLFGDTLWTRTYSGGIGHSVEKTSDGGFIIGGATFGTKDSPSDVQLIRTDGAGDALWTRTYELGGNDRAYSVQQTFDGGFVVGATTMCCGDVAYNIFASLIRTNSSGDTLWTRTYGGTKGTDADGGYYSVQQTNDGGFVVSGWISSPPTTNRDLWLIRLASDTGMVAIQGNPNLLPPSLMIYQIYPNPFNPTTTIQFSVPSSGLITLIVYDMLGREIETILKQKVDAGYHTIKWDAGNVPTGIYFVTMVTGDFRQTRKVMVLK